MPDREDREALLEWGLKLGMGFMAILGASVTLGIAWRLFEAVKG